MTGKSGVAMMKLAFISFTGVALMSTAALAGLGAAPLPLAGVAGPVGLLVAAAGYGLYRTVKYFRQ